MDIIVEGKDEVGVLAQSFSTMVEGLRKAEAQQIKIAEQRIKMAQVKSMVESAAFNIMFADMDFKMIYLNPAAKQTLKTLEHLLPCKVEEIIGKSLDIFHKDPDRIKKILSDPKNLPHSALIKLGDETLDININAIYDDDENRIGSTVSWQLSTDKVKLLESLTETSESMALSSKELATSSQQMSTNSDEAKQQAGKVSTVSKETNQNVQAVAAIQEISKIIGKIDDIATTIAGSIEEQTATTTEITKNIAEAAKGTSDVVENAEGITSASKKAAEGALNVLTASQGLSKLAGELRELVRNRSL